MEIDFLKPLMKEINIRIAGERLWIPLKYEGLPSFCFNCGVIGHFFKSCPLRDRDADLGGGDWPFGMDLKAPPLRRRAGSTIMSVDVGG